MNTPMNDQVSAYAGNKPRLAICGYVVWSLVVKDVKQGLDQNMNNSGVQGVIDEILHGDGHAQVRDEPVSEQCIHQT